MYVYNQRYLKYFRSQEGDDLDEEKQGSRGKNLNESYTCRKTLSLLNKIAEFAI